MSMSTPRKLMERVGGGTGVVLNVSTSVLDAGGHCDRQGWRKLYDDEFRDCNLKNLNSRDEIGVGHALLGKTCVEGL